MVDPVTTTALAKAAASAFARLGGQQLADRVAALVDVQRSEIKLLNELQLGVDRLLAAPLQEAGMLLEDANRPYRSDDDRRRLLDEARGALTRARAQDSDPLRLSAASLLLAGVWLALGYPQDAPGLIRVAHEHAVQAALALADAVPSPPPRARPIPFRMLFGSIPQVTWRGAMKGRPKTLRIGNVSSISAFGHKLVEIDQYAATDNALEDEQTMLAIDGWVRILRDMRLDTDDSADAVPEYRVRLIPSVRATTKTWGVATSAVFYGLTYEEVQPSEAVPAPTELPSEQFPTLRARFLPGDNQVPPPA